MADNNSDDFKPHESKDVAAEIYQGDTSAIINLVNPKAVKEPEGIIRNLGDRQPDNKILIKVPQIVNMQQEGAMKILNVNSILANLKTKLKEKGGVNKGKLSQFDKTYGLHKSSKHEEWDDASVKHDRLKNNHNRLKRHDNTSHIAFSACLGHTILHTAPGHTIKCDQVILNYGNGYNSHTRIFMAKVTRAYLFTFSIAVEHHGRWVAVKLVVDNRNIVDAAVDTVSL